MGPTECGDQPASLRLRDDPYPPTGGFLAGLSGIPSLPLDIALAYKVYLIAKPFLV